MKDGKFRVGFDIGGTIGKYPDIMKALMRALAASPEHEVFIITDMPSGVAEKMLAENGIPCGDGRLLCCDFSARQDMCKAILAETHGIDVMIDDRPDYVAAGFPLGLVVSPRPALPYDHPSWKKPQPRGGRRDAMLSAVVFDFGEVLVETGPKFLYQKIFPTEEETRFFLENILTQPLRSSWHSGACVGDEVKRLAARHPEHAEAILAFHSRFIETIRGPVDGMPELVHELKARGMRLYGLTNWAKDTFSVVPATFPFLRLLDDVIVSGAVGVKKPDPVIFDLAIRRFQLDPATTLFADDKQANVDAAARAGFLAVRFENAGQLRAVIESCGAS